MTEIMNLIKCKYNLKVVLFHLTTKMMSFYSFFKFSLHKFLNFGKRKKQTNKHKNKRFRISH